MSTIYVGIINKIVNPEDRTSFSKTIPFEIIDSYIPEDDIKSFETGITIKAEDLVDYPTHQIFLNYLHAEGYWSDIWMNEWNSMTIYRLYHGREESNL